MLSPTRRSYVAVLVSLVAVALGSALAAADDVRSDVRPTPRTGVIRGRLTIDGKSEHRKFRIDESVVSLKGGDLAQLSAKPPSEPVVVDQNGIAYVPTVLAIVAGTTVVFRNSDPTLHNVHCQCVSNKPFNIGMGQGETSRVRFDKPEVVEVTCNIHANMHAWIVVLESSFFSMPRSGEFRIEGVPEGEFELKGWHEGTKPVVQKVTVRAGADTVVDLDLTSKRR